MTAPTAFVGHAAGSEYGQVMADILEYVPDLFFPQSTWVYSKMRNDPQLQGILAAYTLPIRKADWRVDPAGCKPAVAQEVADDLGIPLLGADPKPQAARRRGVVWAEHLRLAVPGHIVFGFYPFEKRYDTSSGQARLVELAERVPASVSNIMLDKQGGLAGIQQDFSTEMIGRDRLAWYVHGKEGSNWQGRSMLRAAYGPWLLKHEMWRVHGTSIRRFGMGLPTVNAPAGATVVQIAEAQRLASSMRGGETAGMGLPAGFTASIAGMTGSVPDALAFIKYLDGQMSTMALSGLLDLGSTEHGSRALGDVFEDLLHDAVQTVGDQVAAMATADLAVQIVDFNHGDDEPAPRIVCGDIGGSREVTIEALKLLLEAGALTADPELEAYLRSKYHLPERDKTAPTPARIAAVPARPVAAAAAKPKTKLRREPTTVEASAKTDFAQVQTEWQTALDDLVSSWADVTEAQIDELVDQVAAAVEADDVTALTDVDVDTAAGAKLLEAAMTTVAASAAATMAAEAKAQGQSVTVGEPDDARLGQVAVAVAAAVGAGLVLSANRKALQVWTPTSSPADVSAAVRSHLEGLAGAALRDNLGAALSTAQNTGRVATLEGAPVAAMYVASEILDSNSCEACVDVDGLVFDDLDAAAAAYANGGYVGCLGGLRCRGILVTVWND